MTKHMSPEVFDAVMKTRPRDRVIWTAKSIGERIGRSEDFVRDVLAKMPGSPVHKIGGRLCVVEDSLFDFLRNPEDTR